MHDAGDGDDDDIPDFSYLLVLFAAAAADRTDSVADANEWKK